MTTRWKVIRSPPVRIVLAFLLVGGAVGYCLVLTGRLRARIWKIRA